MRAVKILIRKFSFAWLPILRAFMPFLYDRDILDSKHFDPTGSMVGYVWLSQGLWFQKILGFNRRVPWPMSPTSKVVGPPRRIKFPPEGLRNLQSPGCYFQTLGGNILIGDGCYVGPNVGIITANHSVDDLSVHDVGTDVVLGDNCWIGMNSVILPGVHLGESTIVGAGSVVTKSFPQGFVILAGSPARITKEISRGNEAPRTKGKN